MACIVFTEKGGNWYLQGVFRRAKGAEAEGLDVNANPAYYLCYLSRILHLSA